MTIPVIELGIGTLALFFLSARSVPKGRRVLVLRAGKLRRWRGPGFFFAIPFVDAMVAVPVGEQSVEIPVAGPEGGEARLHVSYGYAAAALVKEGYRLREVLIAHGQASEATWKRLEGEAALEIARRGPEQPLSHEEYEEALDNLEHSDLTEEQKESVRQALERKLGWEP